MKKTILTLSFCAFALTLSAQDISQFKEIPVTYAVNGEERQGQFNRNNHRHGVLLFTFTLWRGPAVQTSQHRNHRVCMYQIFRKGGQDLRRGPEAKLELTIIPNNTYLCIPCGAKRFGSTAQLSKDQ